MADLIFVLLGFVSCLISAIFGFGSALFVLAIGAYILPVKETIALGAVLFTASGMSKVILFRKYVDWSTAGIMAIGSIPFSYIGASLVPIAPAEVLRKGLGLMVLCYLIFSLSSWQIKIKIERVGLIFGSGIYGFLSGFLGGGNVVTAILFQEMGLQKEAFVGAMAATSLLANVVKVITYSKNSLITEERFSIIIGLICSAIFAVFLGRTLLKELSVKHFRRGVLAMLGIVAIGLIF